MLKSSLVILLKEPRVDLLFESLSLQGVLEDTEELKNHEVYSSYFIPNTNLIGLEQVKYDIRFYPALIRGYAFFELHANTREESRRFEYAELLHNWWKQLMKTVEPIAVFISAGDNMDDMEVGLNEIGQLEIHPMKNTPSTIKYWKLHEESVDAIING